MMVPSVRKRFGDFSRRFPNDILFVAGAPGTGKTTFLSQLVASRACAYKSISCFAPTNAAVTVFFDRYTSVMRQLEVEDDFLAIRAFPTHLEVDVVKHFLENHHGQDEWDRHACYNKQHTIGPLATTEWRKEGSMASVVLQLLGKIKSPNAAVNRLRKSPLIATLLKRISQGASGGNNADDEAAAVSPANEPDVPRNGVVASGPTTRDVSLQDCPVEQCDESTFRGKSQSALIRLLIRQILWRTSALFTTTHVAADQALKPFTETAEEYAGDEMGCTTVPEVLAAWRHNRPPGHPRRRHPPTAPRHPVEERRRSRTALGRTRCTCSTCARRWPQAHGERRPPGLRVLRGCVPA